jgi:hypothetical protein
MISLNQIAYRILESVRGNITKDENIDLREIKYDIINLRAKFLKDYFSKFRRLDSSLKQNLGCEDVIQVDSSECCLGEVDCTILRTKNKVPKPLVFRNTEMFTRIGPVNMMERAYEYVSYERAQVSGNGRFNKNMIFAFYKDGYIYLKGNGNFYSSIEKINIQGVFEDAEAASKFTTCDGEACYTHDDEYPINAWMLKGIEDTIKSSYAALDAIVPTDENLDNQHKLDNGTKS